MKQLNFITEEIHGTRLHFLQTDKYKTTIAVINIAIDLTEENVTKVALLPYLLKRGCKNYPSIIKLQEELDSLYGTLLSIDLFKRGEQQIVQFSIEAVNERYLSSDINVLLKAFILLTQVIVEPLNTEEGFNKAYLETEKLLLANRVQSILDDKIRYAEYKTIEHMYEGEPYRLLVYGQTEDLKEIDGTNLYKFYLNWLHSSPIDIFIVGDTDISEISNIIKNNFNFLGSKNSFQPQKERKFSIKEKLVTEELDINQSKLNLGLRSKINISSDAYIDLLVYNGILGGFAHSKLFVNVREKASLAYYASSKLESHQGIITIQSGIEEEQFTAALKIIREQLVMIRNGQVSEQELVLTKALYKNQFMEIIDQPRRLVDFQYHSILSGKKRTIMDYQRSIAEVKLEDVVSVANQVEIDTIYFLTGRGGKQYANIKL